MKEGDFFKVSQWISWMGATVFAVICIIYYVFITFETKADSIDKRDQIIMRLDRIEHKIDLLQK